MSSISAIIRFMTQVEGSSQVQAYGPTMAAGTAPQIVNITANGRESMALALAHADMIRQQRRNRFMGRAD